MASNACISRLQKELREIQKNPLPGLRALPSPSNILEWHYVLEGDKDGEYANGWYHGKLIFQPTYPFKPPAILMLTPSGRFEPGAKICLSMSDFHPETWVPSWGVNAILLGLQSFFYENTSTTGAITGVPTAQKRVLAERSLEFNARNITFRKLFPELVELLEEQTREKQQAAQQQTQQAQQRGAGRAAAAAQPNGRDRAPAAGNLQQGDVGDAQRGRQQQLGLRDIFMGAAVLVAAVAVASMLLQ